MSSILNNEENIEHSITGTLNLELDVRWENGEMSLIAVKGFHFAATNSNVSSSVYSNANPTTSWNLYNLIKLSAKSEIAKTLKLRETITLRYGERTFIAKTHASIPGRIDGLSAFYRDHPKLVTQKVLHFFFDIKKRELRICTELHYTDAVNVLQARGEIEAVKLLENYVAEKKSTSGWDGFIRGAIPRLGHEFNLPEN